VAFGNKTWIVGVAIGLLGCKSAHSHASSSTEGGEDTTASHAEAVEVEAPSNNPAERDDAKAAVLRVDLRGPEAQPVPVPYVYGYPLYAEGPALQGVRMLRQDNWLGYTREERKSQDGLVRLVETFPEIGCVFEGVQEDVGRYVPLSMECEQPAPKKRGGKRPVVGAVQAGAKADAVPKEPSMAKAFLGEWHATTAGFESGNGAAYFDTPHGLIGFGFKKGRLNSIGFVFDPPEKRWREPELWQPPAGYAVTP
jgi:hypothetical protein